MTSRRRYRTVQSLGCQMAVCATAKSMLPLRPLQHGACTHRVRVTPARWHSRISETLAQVLALCSKLSRNRPSPWGPASSSHPLLF